jgi:hypothetical protein
MKFWFIETFASAYKRNIDIFPSAFTKRDRENVLGASLHYSQIRFKGIKDHDNKRFQRSKVNVVYIGVVNENGRGVTRIPHHLTRIMCLII